MRVCVLTMCCLVALFGAGVATSVIAAPSQQSTSDTAIPVMPLDKALNAFAQREHLQLVYVSKIADGVRTKGAPAGLSPEATLRKLLEGTGLGYRFLNAKTVTIYMLTEPQTSKGASTKEPAASAKAIRAEEPTVLDAVSVTGTRIKGGTVPSPVITIGSERIQEEGFTDLGEVIRDIPQNFSGGQNPGVAAGATSGAGGIANQNITGGSSLNLRGLGPDATLTLLNGRRLSYDGFAQAVDISAIPVEAVDRIEIVADGASAIYGSDAVGGVGNVILKRDYSGVAVGTLYGDADHGGLTTHEYNATAGTTWSGGGLIATYKYAKVAPIFASQRPYTADMAPPTTIYPGSDLRSGLFSGHQSLGEILELRVDALRTEREQRSYSYYSGVSSYYSRLTPETTTTLVAPTLEASLGNDWNLSMGATWGRDKRMQREWMTVPGTGAMTQSPYDDCYCNESRSYEVGAEGPLFPLAGGDARLAVGAGYRKNKFSQRNTVSSVVSIQGEEGSRFAYAELNMPLISPASAGGRTQRLTFTAAVRGEDYDSFGSVVTPKIGLVYAPTGDYTLKASWGRSFKAPTLLQRYQSQNAILYPAAVFGGGSDPDATVLSTFGGNAHLDAERARTWTASLAIHPQALDALEAELTWFDIDYTQRVVQPIGNYAEALTNPAYGRYVDRSPTTAEQADILAETSAFYNYTASAYDPARVVALIYANYVNVAEQRIRGLDVSGSYRFTVGPGRLVVRGSGSWLDSTQKNDPADPAYDLAGTLYSPAKIKARAGVVWLQGGFTASAFVNYIGGVTSTVDMEKMGSFTTVDATLRYSIDQHGSAQSGWDFALSAQNLLDRKPPLYRPLDPTWVPYDSTNYSAIGRFLSVSVTRRF